ncbi:MAG: hypothetical protein RL220_1625 [Bacteroidota bacterium]|jgi:ligand-binding SRPBCC domain-containing protein
MEVSAQYDNTLATYRLKYEQHIPASLEEIWEFISSPHNLKVITPPYMGFIVTSEEVPEKMYPGLIITYKVSPVAGLPMPWVTEITQVKEGAYFVDEQRIGPYKLWHHEHHLEAVQGGVAMTDIIHYSPPMGILGAAANQLFIKKKLEEIFRFRKKKLEEIFGEWNKNR